MARMRSDKWSLMTGLVEFYVDFTSFSCVV